MSNEIPFLRKTPLLVYMLKQAYIIRKYRTREYSRLSRKIFGFYAGDLNFTGWIFVTYSRERVYGVIHSHKISSKEYFFDISEFAGL